VSPCRCRRFARLNGIASVEITRQDLDATQLWAEAGRTADAKQARRILAVAMVLDGHSRLLAAQAGGMDRQTLRNWVHRYNAEGLAGLADRPRSGPTPRLTDAQMTDLARWVEDGPDLAKDGVVVRARHFNPPMPRKPAVPAIPDKPTARTMERPQASRDNLDEKHLQPTDRPASGPAIAPPSARAAPATSARRTVTAGSAAQAAD
jgi:transposase